MTGSLNSNKKLTNVCRSCRSSSVSNLEITHWVFPAKPLNWINILCHNCGLISHYKENGKLITYSDQAYRKKGVGKVYPPISLPWSTVSFKRWKHIAKVIENSVEKDSLSSYSILDYGGYNGLLARALKQHWGSDCTVADLDQEGLDFSAAMGFKVINLSKQPDLTEKYNLITMVHVLEHVEDPRDTLLSLTNALEDLGSIYIEVPNLFGFPLIDDAHLSTFTLDSLSHLSRAVGLEILTSGYCQTPPEAINYDYPFSTKKENIFILARKSSTTVNGSVDQLGSRLRSDIRYLKTELTKNYAYRGFAISASYFRAGISKVLLSTAVFLISIVSLIPLLRSVVTSRSMYIFLKKIQKLIRNKKS